MFIKLITYVPLLLLLGCDKQYLGSSTVPTANVLRESHYQIVADTQGGVWQLVTQAYEIKWCVSFAPVANAPIRHAAISK